ncbi:hypothetical protein [Streptomyces phaeochromogenes]|uniref:hypothetical protein n=1 Tax=Streptomyces phaeochromogenes TaxID=1923 RepID=UPI00386F4C86|nr:transposase family protein [Streptomyces phaeochromogenes]
MTILRCVRRHAVCPAHAKPELSATRPNEIWCRDVTRLRGPGKRVFCHLYSILDTCGCYTGVRMVGVLTAVQQRNPERFVNKPPVPPITPPTCGSTSRTTTPRRPVITTSDSGDPGSLDKP